MLVWHNNRGWLDVRESGGGSVPISFNMHLTGIAFGWTLKRMLIDVEYFAVIDPADYDTPIVGWAPMCYGVMLFNWSDPPPDNLNPITEPDHDWLWTEAISPEWRVVDNKLWSGSPAEIVTAQQVWHCWGHTGNVRDVHGQRTLPWSESGIYFAGRNWVIGGECTSLSAMRNCNSVINVRTLWDNHF